MCRHTPMATISGNQNVAVAHASTTIPSMNGATDEPWRRSGGEQQVGAGEDGDGDGAGGDPRRWVGLGRIELDWNVQRRNTIVITITYSTTPSVNAASRERQRVAAVAGEQQRGEDGDRLGRHGEEEPGAVDARSEARLAGPMTTAISVA